MNVQAVIKAIKDTHQHGRFIFVCGNGGSACNAIHFSEDLQGKNYRAMHFCDIGFLTATANDYGYQHVFSRPLRLWGKEGDLLLTLSCSGTSKNILSVQRTAHDLQIPFIAFPTNAETGEQTPHTETIHLDLIHTILDLL